MAQAKRKRRHFETSSGNVFADLGLPNAVERKNRVKLAVFIQREIEARRWTQAKAAEVLGITQPKVSALMRFKLEGFSVERLMKLVEALGNDVEITIKPRRLTRAGRVAARA